MVSVKLIERNTGKIAVYLSAIINEDGDLVLEGQDLGAGVEEYWGDSDYEYWVVVSASNKLKVFLLLTQYAFKNIGELIKWLDNIEVEYDKVGNNTAEQLITVEADDDQMVFNINLGGLGIKDIKPILRLARKHEDKLILMLLQYMFQNGMFKNDSAFMDWLKRNNIEYKFHSYA